MGKDNRRRRRPRRNPIEDNYVPQGDAEKLALPIEQMGLSERTTAALLAGGLTVARELACRRMSQMYRIQNIGKKNCIEIARKLQEYGSGFRPEEVEASGQPQQERPAQQAQPHQEEARKPRQENTPKEAPRNRADNQAGRADRNARGEQNAAKASARAQERRRGRDKNAQRIDPEAEERRRRIAQIYQVNRQLNDSLSRQYSGMTINEILNGKRERPVVAREERPPLTPDSIVKFCRKGKWGYKDWKGNVLIAPVFDEAYPFSEGLACVEKDGKLGYIDRSGAVVIDYQYDTATNFRQGLASVTVGEKSGYIDPQGNIVVPMQFDVATAFDADKAVVFADGRWGVLNRETLKVFWR